MVGQLVSFDVEMWQAIERPHVLFCGSSGICVLGLSRSLGWP
jgi:hypothetical protein